MGLKRDIRIKRLLRRFDRAHGEERRRLHGEIRDLLAEGREDAIRRTNYVSFCIYSTPLGQLFLETTDPSDALRPLACSYLTACMEGDRLDKERGEAAGALSRAYAMTGNWDFAAEMAYEALAVGGGEAGQLHFQDLLVFLGSVDNEDGTDNSLIRRIYDEDVRPLLEEMPVDWASAIRVVLDTYLGFDSPSYDELNARAGSLSGEEFSDLTWVTHRTLASVALEEGRLKEAAQHIDHALAHMDMEDLPWLRAPLLGLSARVRLAAGDVDEAFHLASLGCAVTRIAFLACKDDFARMSVARLGESCRDVAFAVASERRDWDLLSELIENDRLQATPVSHGDKDEKVASRYPDWLIDRFVEVLKGGAARAGIQAVMCDWKSGLRDQAIVGWRGSSATIEALTRAGVGLNDYEYVTYDAFEALEDDLKGGSLAWLSATSSGRLYWTVTDEYGSFDGGVIDLTSEYAQAALSALREVVVGERHLTDKELAGIDALVALSQEGSLDEKLLLDPLAELVPEYLRAIALERTDDDPVRVLMAVPPELSAVPWAVLPLNQAGGEQIRLVERVELTLITPTAVRTSTRGRRERSGIEPHRVIVSCSNPAGDLLPWEPVRGDVVLAAEPYGSNAVPLERFIECASNTGSGDGGVLFVRSHLAQESNAGYVADEGIAFSNGVLSARSLSLRELDGSPVCPMPQRVVLALCSGAGAADAAGLSLGLAAACRLSGADEVVASLFNVLDSGWSCEFDHRLAAVSCEPGPLSVSLRRLQLQALQEWRLASVNAIGAPAGDGPNPLVWAAYVVVR